MDDTSMKFKRIFGLLMMAMCLNFANAANAMGAEGPTGKKGPRGDKGCHHVNNVYIDLQIPTNSRMLRSKGVSNPQ